MEVGHGDRQVVAPPRHDPLDQHGGEGCVGVIGGQRQRAEAVDGRIDHRRDPGGARSDVEDGLARGHLGNGASEAEGQGGVLHRRLATHDRHGRGCGRGGGDRPDHLVTNQLVRRPVDDVRSAEAAGCQEEQGHHGSREPGHGRTVAARSRAVVDTRVVRLDGGGWDGRAHRHVTGAQDAGSARRTAGITDDEAGLEVTGAWPVDGSCAVHPSVGSYNGPSSWGRIPRWRRGPDCRSDPAALDGGRQGSRYRPGRSEGDGAGRCRAALRPDSPPAPSPPATGRTRCSRPRGHVVAPKAGSVHSAGRIRVGANQRSCRARGGRDELGGLCARRSRS